MLIVQLFASQARLSVYLADNVLIRNEGQCAKLKALQESIFADVEIVKKKMDDPNARSSLKEALSASSRKITDLAKCVQGVEMTARTKHTVTVINLAADLYHAYIELHDILLREFQQVYRSIIDHFIDKNNVTFVSMVDQLIQIVMQLKWVEFGKSQLMLLLDPKNLRMINAVFHELLSLKLKAIFDCLEILLTKPVFLRALANDEQLTAETNRLLTMQSKLKHFLDKLAKFNVNVNSLEGETSWDLTAVVNYLYREKPRLFLVAEKKQAELALIRAVDTKQREMKSFFSWVLYDKKVLKKEEAMLNDVREKMVVGFSEEPVHLDKCPLLYTTTVFELNRQIAAFNHLFTVNPTIIVMSENAAGTQAIADSLVHHAACSSTDNHEVRTRIFQSRVQDDLTSDEAVSALPPQFQQMMVAQLHQYRLKSIKEEELSYIFLENRTSLSLFYNTFLAKWQIAYHAYMNLASGFFKQNLKAKSSVGAMINMLGQILGPFGGLIFSIAGDTITSVIERQERIKARNVAYLGLGHDVLDTMEFFARRITLQYELQIRLLKAVAKCKNPQSSYEKDDRSLPKIDIIEGSKLSMAEFKETITGYLRNKSLLAKDVLPPQMLAEYVVALLFANLLIATKIPNTHDEIIKFCYKVLLETDLSNLDADTKVFDALGFYEFANHRTKEPWHASDIFREPNIGVRDENNNWQFWQKPGSKKDYFWRPGTAEEAKALGYALQADTTTAASTALACNSGFS